MSTHNFTFLLLDLLARELHTLPSSLFHPLNRQLLMDLSFPCPLRPHHLGIDLGVRDVHDDLWAREQAVDLLERQVARFGIWICVRKI
jgi:hypothetical protein